MWEARLEAETSVAADTVYSVFAQKYVVLNIYLFIDNYVLQPAQLA